MAGRTRFHVSFSDARKYEKLRARAIARGEDVDESDDWFEPPDIETDEDAGNDYRAAYNLAERIAKTHALYGEASLYEATGEYGEYDLVETFYA